MHQIAVEHLEEERATRANENLLFELPYPMAGHREILDFLKFLHSSTKSSKISDYQKDIL